MLDLTGKVILVTGASRGIGAAIARAVARAGADVVLHYGRSREAAEDLAEAIGAEHCHLVAADLESGSAAPALWRDAVAWKGRIDVLVNNAGIWEPAALDADDETFDRAWTKTLRVNLVAAANLCRSAIRHFSQRGGGTIVNIASRSAFRGEMIDYMNYAASKGGLVALTRSIARGCGGDNILAYVVAPGWVRTDMAEGPIRRLGEARLTEEIPLGEIAKPEDVAEIVTFLASGLARHATGATIDVNGASYLR